MDVDMFKTVLLSIFSILLVLSVCLFIYFLVEYILAHWNDSHPIAYVSWTTCFFSSSLSVYVFFCCFIPLLFWNKVFIIHFAWFPLFFVLILLTITEYALLGSSVSSGLLQYLHLFRQIPSFPNMQNSLLLLLVTVVVYFICHMLNPDIRAAK